MRFIKVLLGLIGCRRWWRWKKICSTEREWNKGPIFWRSNRRQLLIHRHQFEGNIYCQRSTGWLYVGYYVFGFWLRSAFVQPHVFLIINSVFGWLVGWFLTCFLFLFRNDFWFIALIGIIVIRVFLFFGNWGLHNLHHRTGPSCPRMCADQPVAQTWMPT